MEFQVELERFMRPSDRNFGPKIVLSDGTEWIPAGSIPADHRRVEITDKEVILGLISFLCEDGPPSHRCSACEEQMDTMLDTLKRRADRGMIKVRVVRERDKPHVVFPRPEDLVVTPEGVADFLVKMFGFGWKVKPIPHR